jgi:MFS family permease
MWLELKRDWPTLLGCIIGLGMGASMLLYINGVFVTSFQAEFGWTRSQLSSVNVISVCTVIPIAPFAGYIVDRFGVRLPAALGMVGLALGFVALGSMSGSFIQYVFFYVGMAVLSLLSSAIAFTRAINERFDAARGLALGIAMAGQGISGTLAPPILAGIIAAEGWRTAFFKLAVAVILTMPVVLLLLRGRPADKKDRDAPRREFAAKLPIRSIVGDARFLRLMAIMFFMALGVTGFTFHLMPMLTDHGLSAVEAAKFQALFGISVIGGRLTFGASVDHFFAPYVAALAMSFTVIGIAGMAVLGPPMAPLFAIAIGLALGAEGDLIGYLTARYYGMFGYGQRYGVLYGSYLLANGFSPLVIAVIAEWFGGYEPALWTCASFGAVAIVLLVTAPRFPATMPRQPAQSYSTSTSRMRV